MKTWNLIMAAAMAAGFCAGRAWAIDSASSGYWDAGGTWVGGNPPTASDGVVIKAGHTVTIRTNTAINVKSMTVENTGVLTHLVNGTTAQGELYKIVLNIAEGLNIVAGGTIHGDSRGYAGNQGPGVGSHGGRGGPYGGIVYGPTYGSYMSPTNLGSGGSYAPGGGAVILDVTGSSVLNGTISAVGGNVLGWGAPGGSVYLRTGTIAGSGTITANGNNGAGGNGGGRIAIILTGTDATFSDFSGATVSAYGGAYAFPAGGAAGTIYTETKAQAGGQGVLTIDNLNRATAGDITTAIPSGQSWTAPYITLSRGGILGIPGGVTFDLTNSIVTFDTVTYNSGISLLGGTLIVPEALAYTNFVLGYVSASTFSPTSITVGNHAQFVTYVNYTLPGDFTVQTGGTYVAGTGIFTVGGNVLVAGGTLTHLANRETETYKLNLAVHSNLTVQAGSRINVDARGYSSGFGPGPGSHGGVGASSACGPTYGSLTAPTNLGSSGLTFGAPGGGAAIIAVAGASDLAGTISAVGGIAVGWAAPGGSIYLRTGTLTGSPTIKANGASGAYSDGGGRIAIVLTGDDADFSNFGGAVLSAYAGSDGAVGTIYMETQTQGPGKGTLLIDANKVASTYNTLIGNQVTDTVVGSVIITNAARLAVSNQTLTVQGDWVNKATFIAMTNSTVNFAGATVSTIYTNNTFFNLTCTNAGKALVFEAGRTNMVTGLLKLGASQSGQTVTLQSTTNGSWSYLTLVSGGTQQIARVNVKDNNAGGGQTLRAGGGSANGGNNINWQFPPSGTMFVVK